MNLTFFLSVSATLLMGLAVWLAGSAVLLGAYWAIGLAYASGLLISVATRYQISVEPETAGDSREA